MNDLEITSTIYVVAYNEINDYIAITLYEGDVVTISKENIIEGGNVDDVIADAAAVGINITAEVFDPEYGLEDDE
jgi:hypothetical protein|tara:strand:- start:667 stop:891 length:225 start_codon:yes stop_codon:yes gene_type:complete